MEHVDVPKSWEFVIARWYKASTAEWVRLEDKFRNPLSKTFYGGKFPDCGRRDGPQHVAQKKIRK